MPKILPLLILSSIFFSACGAPSAALPSQKTYPLYFSTMTHMEGEFKDDTDEDLFMLHVSMLRYAMDLAEEYDAILTVESEKPFAKANTLWDLNIMKEILDRGHGVSTHCDLGFSQTSKKDPLTVEELAAQMVENKSLVDELVGAENNHGCSGAGSMTDWVSAAQEAGFDYINGIVGMHLLAVPQAARPDPTWNNQYIINEGYHQNVPEDLMDRIYLMKLANADDFEADETGLVISNGELGPLANMEEGGESKICGETDCPLTEEDVDTLVEAIKAVSSQQDPSRVAKLTTYLPVNLFASKNETVLRYFFSEMQKLQEAGTIQWSSQWDIVKTYLDANP
jgi:hypothetical protein